MQNYIKSLLNGSTQQYITLSNLRQIPIEMPENKGDMKKIIKVLDLIDKKIQINTKTNDNLLKIGLELLKEDFNKKTEYEVLSNAIKFVKGKRPLDITPEIKEKYKKYLSNNRYKFQLKY